MPSYTSVFTEKFAGYCNHCCGSLDAHRCARNRPLSQLYCFSLQQAVFWGASTLPRTSSLIWPIIISLFNCTIFSDMVCRLLSEWCVATSFYQRYANRVSFYLFFNLCNLLYLIFAGGGGRWTCQDRERHPETILCTSKPSAFRQVHHSHAKPFPPCQCNL